MKLYITGIAAALAAWIGSAAVGQAQGPRPFRVAVMDDMSGVYKDIQGPGDVVAARMAVEDYGGKALGRPIEVLSGDLQNKVDVGAALARRWYDEDGVTAIFGLGNSAVALAVQQIGRDKKRIDVVTSAGSTELTGKSCSPYGVHWTYDTYALAKGAAGAVLSAGGKDWFFVTADYAFGHALEADASRFVKDGGGKVVGAVRTPLGTSDYSSALLQAQSAGADVVGIAAAGGDMINVVKQMAEFDMVGHGVRAAGLLTLITDVKAIGLPTAQGLSFVEAFYWDQNDRTRAFSDRFAKLFGKPPTSFQASIYGAVQHYLKAVDAVGSDDPDKVMAKMRDTPINDFMTTNGRLRIDGRVVRDMYLLQAKAPADSKSEWDLARVVATIPGDEAFRPLSEGNCPLAAK